MMNGDCLVTKRSDGRFDVFKVTPSGAPLPVRRDIPDGIMAWLVAQARLAPTGGDVYYKDQSEPDSAIRPYRPA